MPKEISNTKRNANAILAKGYVPAAMLAVKSTIEVNRAVDPSIKFGLRPTLSRKYIGRNVSS